MRVTAVPDLRVPKERSREVIEHNPAEPVDVPDTSYYRKRIAAGELVIVPAAPAAEAQPVSTAEPETTATGAKKAAKAKGAAQ